MNKQTSIIMFIILFFLTGCVPDQRIEVNSPDDNLSSNNSDVLGVESTVITPDVNKEETPDIPTANNQIAIKSSPTPRVVSTLAPGTLIVSSIPTGAEISIMETEVSSTTPYSTTLLPGSYTVKLNQPGYQLWEETVLVDEGEISEIHVELILKPFGIGEYTTLVELDQIGEISEQPFLAYVAWDPETESFSYALNSGVNLAEAKDWIWWQYDLASQESQQINPPKSLVDDVTRKELGLCPLNELEWDGPAKCSYLTSLFENQENNLIAYSPLLLEDFPYGEGELWIAKADGTWTQQLSDFAPAYAHWSSDGQWLATGMAFAGLPGQVIHYLVKTDGTFIRDLQSITGVDNFYLNGLFPEFSPDGQQLLYVGSMVPGSRQVEDYQLFSLNLNNLESRPVSDKFGLFQWASNSEGIYVLDGAFTPFDALKIGSMQNVDLYYIDITQDPIQEHTIANDIPFHSYSDYGSWNWAYSPTHHAIAYIGYNEKIEFGILQLESHTDGDE